MATLDATPSGESSNSYVSSTSEAATIAATLASFASLGVSTTAFTSVSDSVKTDALIFAATSIDNLQFVGEKVYESQSMQFPRAGMRRPTDENVVPDAIKWAQVAEACAILSSSNDPVKSAIDRGVVSESAGGVSFTVGNRRGTAGDRGVSQQSLDIIKKSGLLRPAAASVYNGRG